MRPSPTLGRVVVVDAHAALLLPYRGAMDARRPVRVLDEAERLEVIRGIGLEGCAGDETIDEMRDHAIKAGLIAGVVVVRPGHREAR